MADSTRDPQGPPPRRQLFSREDEVRAHRLARDPQGTNELQDLAAQTTARIVSFVSQLPEIQQRIAGRPNRIIGADLHVEEPGTFSPRFAEVGIYFYDQDVLLSVIVDLRNENIVRTQEFSGFQPPPSPAEQQEAEALVRRSTLLAGRADIANAQAVVLSAIESSMEGNPLFGHRALQVTFWAAESDASGNPRRVAGPVVADLSRSEVHTSIFSNEP